MSVVDGYATERQRHDRLVVALTVLAVLVVVGLPAALAGLDAPGGHGPVEQVALTDNARRVLAEVPGAYQEHGLVVVPAATDPYVAWTGVVGPERITGEVVALEVNGITPYGKLPPVAAPDWLFDFGAVDAVVSDVGDLSFACVRPPDVEECRGTLLTQNIGQRFTFGREIGAPGTSEVLRFSGLRPDGVVSVVLGWLPPGAARVSAEGYGRRGEEVAVRTALTDRSGKGIWWLVSDDPVTTLIFRDGGGDVVEHRTVGG